MDATKYSAFTFKDFLEDDDFVNWVISPTAQSDLFWREFLRHYPQKKDDIGQATDFIRVYRKQHTFFNPDSQAAVWKRIESEVGPLVVKENVFRLPQFLRIAAAILLICLAALFVWHNREQNLRTDFGEIKTILMPDGTTVLLNGNSSLTYRRGWGRNSREVWLKGEAFFKVSHLNRDTSHIKTGERFIVHCNDLNIEVLGTTFNVNNRHNKTKVGLVTGKIRVTSVAPTKAGGLILLPGDYVEYTSQTITVKARLPHPEKLISWTKRQFIFRNETLGQILKTLQDSYGYQAKFINPSAKDMKIEGEIEVTGVKELLETISTSLHVNIYQNDDQIIIN